MWAARAFHIQSQERGNRRRYVYVGNLREPDALFYGGTRCDENRLHGRIIAQIAVSTAVFSLAASVYLLRQDVLRVSQSAQESSSAVAAQPRRI